MTGRKKRKLKKSIPFVIVEGQTEENYIELLKNRFSIGAKCKNTTGGNAIGVLKEAKKIIKNNKEYYSTFFIWFDSDKIQNSEKFLNLCKKLNTINPEVFIMISKPCVEAFLLAHFIQLNENQLNNDCTYYEHLLKDHIANYEKDNLKQLKQHINQSSVCNVLTNYPCETYNLNLLINYFLERTLPEKGNSLYNDNICEQII